MSFKSTHIKGYISTLIFIVLAMSAAFGQVTPSHLEKIVLAKEPEPDIYAFCDKDPRFNGDLPSFVQQNLVYPPDAAKNNLTGTCYIEFVLYQDGRTDLFRVVRGVPNCPQCDAEALRVAKLMKDFTPGEINGRLVNSRFRLPIRFMLK